MYLLCYSNHSKKSLMFLDNLKSIPTGVVKLINVDDKGIRDIVTKSKTLIIKTVPTFLYFSNKDVMVYENDKADEVLKVLVSIHTDNKQETKEKEVSSITKRDHTPPNFNNFNSFDKSINVENVTKSDISMRTIQKTNKSKENVSIIQLAKKLESERESIKI